MKPLTITKGVVLYFLGSITFALTSKYDIVSRGLDIDVARGVFYALIQYSALFYFVHQCRKKSSYSTDIFSALFMQVYCVFKFIFFSLLINQDVPTYIHWLDSKLIAIILTLATLVFTAFIFHLTWTKKRSMNRYGHS